MRLTRFCAALLLLSASLHSAYADLTGGVAVVSTPGAAAAAETVALSGTITALDTETRQLTLEIDDGTALTFVAGPDVRNFDQLRIGDAVALESTRALALELRKDSTAEVSRSDEAGMIRAAPGETPGAIGGRRVRIMAEVMAVDAERQTVTLRGPNRTIDLAVADPEQFERISVGDRIEATYVEAIAVAVVHAGD